MTIPLTRNCVHDCGRRIRRKGATLAEAPDTYPSHGKSCKPCHRAIVPELRCSVDHNRLGVIHFLERSRGRKNAMIRRDFYETRLSA